MINKTLEPVFNVGLKFQLNILRILYIALHGYCFVIPVIVLYITDAFGSESHYYYIAIIACIISLFTGIPIGSLADRANRKSLLTFSLLLQGALWVLLAFTPTNIWLWTSVFLLRGIAASFGASTPSAYLHDLLIKYDKESLYAKEESIRASYGIFVMAFIMMISGYLYTIDKTLPFIVNGLFIISCGILFLLFMPSVNDVYHEKNVKKKLFPIEDVLSILKAKNGVGWAVFSGGCWATVTAYIIFIIQSHLTQLELTATVISGIISGVYIFRSIGSRFVHLLISKKSIFLALCLFTVALAGIAYAENIYVIAALIFISSTLREFLSTSYVIMTTTKANPKQKSLTKSVKGFIDRVSAIVFLLFSGIAIETFGTQTAFLFMVIYMIFLTILPWTMFIRKNIDS